MTKYLVDGNSYWRGRGEHLSTFYLYSDMFTSAAVHTQSTPSYMGAVYPLPWGGVPVQDRIIIQPFVTISQFRNVIFTFKQVSTITPYASSGMRIAQEFLEADFPVSELTNSTLTYMKSSVILTLSDGRRISRPRAHATQINVAKGYELVRVEEGITVTSQVTGRNYTHENVQYFAEGMGVMVIEKDDYLAQMASEQVFTLHHRDAANNSTESFSVYAESPRNQNPTCFDLAVPVGEPKGVVESEFMNTFGGSIAVVKDYKDPKWNFYQSTLNGDISPVIIKDEGGIAERTLASIDTVRGGEIKGRETRNRQDAPEFRLTSNEDNLSYHQKFSSEVGYQIYSERFQRDYDINMIVTNLGTNANPIIQIEYRILLNGVMIYSKTIRSNAWSDILSQTEFLSLWDTSFHGRRAQVEYEHPFRVKEDPEGNLYVLYTDDTVGESLTVTIDKIVMNSSGNVSLIQAKSISLPEEAIEADAGANQLKYRKPYGKTIYEMLDSTLVTWNHYIHSADFAILNHETDEIAIVFSLGINMDTLDSALKTKYYMRRHCLYSEYVYTMTASLQGIQGDLRRTYPYKGIHLNSDYQFSHIKVTQKGKQLLLTVVDSSRELNGDSNVLLIAGGKLRGNAIVMSSSNGIVWNRVYLVYHDDQKYAGTAQDALQASLGFPAPIDKSETPNAFVDVVERFIEGMRILDAESIMGNDGFLYVFYSRGGNLYCNRVAPYIMLRPPMWINPSTTYARLSNFSTSVASTETFQDGLHTYSIYKPKLNMFHDSTGGVEYLPVIVDALFKPYDMPFSGGTTTYNGDPNWTAQYLGQTGIVLSSRKVNQIVDPCLFLVASRRKNGVVISTRRMAVDERLVIKKNIKSFTYRESIVGSRGDEKLVFSGTGSYLEITDITDTTVPPNGSYRTITYSNSEIQRSRIIMANVSQQYNGDKSRYALAASLSDEIGEPEFADFDNGSTLFFRVVQPALTRVGFQEVDITNDGRQLSRKIFFTRVGSSLAVRDEQTNTTVNFAFDVGFYSEIEFLVYATRNGDAVQFDMFARTIGLFATDITDTYIGTYTSQGYSTNMATDRKYPFVSPNGYPALSLMMGLGVYITVDNGINRTLTPLQTGGVAQQIAEELFDTDLISFAVGIDKEYRPVENGVVNTTGVEVYSREQNVYYPQGLTVEFHGESAKAGHKYFLVMESEGHVSNALKGKDLRRWSGMNGETATGLTNGEYFRHTEMTLLYNYYVEGIDRIRFTQEEFDGLAIINTNILEGLIEYYSSSQGRYYEIPFSAMKYELQGTGGPIMDPHTVYGDARLIYIPVLTENQDLLGKHLILMEAVRYHYRRIHDVIVSEGITYVGVKDTERGRSVRNDLYATTISYLVYDDNIRIDFTEEFIQNIPEAGAKFKLKNLYTVNGDDMPLAMEPYAHKIMLYRRVGLTCNLADSSESMEMSVAEAQNIDGLMDVDARGISTSYSLSYQIANEDTFYSTVELVNVLKAAAKSKELLLLKPKGVSRVVMNGEIQIEGENFNPLSGARNGIAKTATLEVIEHE